MTDYAIRFTRELINQLRHKASFFDHIHITPEMYDAYADHTEIMSLSELNATVKFLNDQSKETAGDLNFIADSLVDLLEANE